MTTCLQEGRDIFSIFYNYIFNLLYHIFYSFEKIKLNKWVTVLGCIDRECAVQLSVQYFEDVPIWMGTVISLHISAVMKTKLLHTKVGKMCSHNNRRDYPQQPSVNVHDEEQILLD